MATLTDTTAAPFVVRGVTSADLGAVQEAARHLNSVNLPDDHVRLAEVILRSEKSFAGQVEPAQREFMFVMVNHAERVIGASMIFARHGSRRAPHTFFDVIEEERYSETLDRHVNHRVLRIGYNYQGMTEIGGLVVLPEFRGHPAQLGKSLAFVRFLFIALHRELFCDEIVSELMPPLEPDGQSLLWEALGRKFTGLSYQEADRLSRENKEFIHALFPQDPIYAAVLPDGAQAMIGQVGASSKPVEKMLTQAGFSYAHRIDPFDGGPHFHARTDDVAMVKGTRKLPVQVGAPGGRGERPALLAVDLPGPPYFRALRAPARLDGAAVVVDAEAARTLQVTTGDEVGVLPL